MLALAEELADLAPARRGGAAGRDALARADQADRSSSSSSSAFSEEYVVFQLGEQSPEWLERHSEWIAGLVRLEVGAAERGGGPRGDAPEPLVHARPTA